MWQLVSFYWSPLSSWHKVSLQARPPPRGKTALGSHTGLILGCGEVLLYKKDTLDSGNNPTAAKSGQPGNHRLVLFIAATMVFGWSIWGSLKGETGESVKQKRRKA